MRAIKKKKRKLGTNLGNEWNGNRTKMLERMLDKREGGLLHKRSVLEKQGVHQGRGDNSRSADLC